MRLFFYDRQLVGRIEIVPAARASYSFFFASTTPIGVHSTRAESGFGQPPRWLPLGHGAHDQHDEALRHCDRHFRFYG